MTTPQPPNDVGLIGLAVMGQNLALNMADHGWNVAVYNRTTTTMTDFVERHPPGSFTPASGSLAGYPDLESFVASLQRPRRIIILVKAGAPTDAVIDTLVPLLDQGDIIIDGGNAHWDDTIRRDKQLRERNLRFVGSGVSGGEVGARFGPSLMPGGDPEAWEHLKPVWTSIAAKVDPHTGKEITGAEPGKPVAAGEPCAAYIGPDGAGHFVKMVHNGIEYGDMQLICEAFHLLRHAAQLDIKHVADIFSSWNTGDLDSYLIEITADILKQDDPETGAPFVDIVLDTAGQKGTGAWTSIAALTYGTPTPTIAEAVFARAISARKEERVAASGILAGPTHEHAKAAIETHFPTIEAFIDAVGQALYCSKICSYAQGFQLMADAAAEHNWKLNTGTIAMIWRGGCIIRARFLQRIKEAYERDANLPNLLLDPYFSDVMKEADTSWRKVNAAASIAGIPIPAMASALSYFDSYRHDVLPAKLLQAQRDYFGAHTYERTDKPRGQFFHLDWPANPRVQVDA